MTKQTNSGRHAVVIGASVAGLLAARVLSEHFESVTVVDRDHLPSRAEFRKGAPQAQHVHLFLKNGLERVSRWFPNLEHSLREGGMIPVDFGREVAWYNGGGWHKRYAGGPTGWGSSRALLEYQMRAEVEQMANVRIRAQVPVLGLVTDPQKERVTAVRLQQPGGAEEILTADLVVDASGRGSRTPQWLEELGYGRPAVSTIKIDLAYTSRIYRRPASAPDWTCLGVYEEAPGKRQGLILPIEGDRWIVTLAGYHGNHCPTDEAGFLEFARTLVQPEFYEAIRRAEPDGEAVMFRIPASIRHHYEQMKQFPEGLIVMGDALCGFNPSYAQGMTAAAMEATVLEELLGQRGLVDGFSRTFQKRASGQLLVPWIMGMLEDSRHRETVGANMPGFGFMRWYTSRVLKLCSRDEAVVRKFHQVLHMMKPSTILFHPKIIWQVLTMG